MTSYIKPASLSVNSSHIINLQSITDTANYLAQLPPPAALTGYFTRLNMSSPMFPTFPGPPQEEIFLNVGHPISVITRAQIANMLGGERQFEVVGSCNRVAELVDKLAEQHTDIQQHPTHFIDILWNEDLTNPESYGIIISFTNQIPLSQSIVRQQTWFIDTRSLPNTFMYIRGRTAATRGTTLSDMISTIRFACWDSKNVTSAFRACHRLPRFRALMDLQVFGKIVFGGNVARLAELSGPESYLNMLRILEAERWPINWDIEKLQGAAQRIMRRADDAHRALQYMERPLPNDVVYQYVHGFRYMADIYRWIVDLLRRRVITPNDWG